MTEKVTKCGMTQPVATIPDNKGRVPLYGFIKMNKASAISYR
jgi:hypothetical protein